MLLFALIILPFKLFVIYISFRKGKKTVYSFSLLFTIHTKESEEGKG
jgi:hypothetical protein